MECRKAIFLDRDGVINELIPDGTNFRSPRSDEEFIFKEGIAGFIDTFHNKGYLVIVITNQPEVKRGFVTKQQVDRFHQHISDVLHVDDFFICWHDNEDKCSCRKPEPGSVLAAAAKYKIDLKKSYFIGDRLVDYRAAMAAGTNGVILSKSLEVGGNDVVFSSFNEIADYIWAHVKQEDHTDL